LSQLSVEEGFYESRVVALPDFPSGLRMRDLFTGKFFSGKRPATERQFFEKTFIVDKQFAAVEDDEVPVSSLDFHFIKAKLISKIF